MAQDAVAFLTWVYEQDAQDAAEPWCATLLVKDVPVASARGADQLAAGLRPAEVLRERGILEDGPVLGLSGLMRQWRERSRPPSE